MTSFYGDPRCRYERSVEREIVISAFDTLCLARHQHPPPGCLCSLFPVWILPLCCIGEFYVGSILRRGGAVFLFLVPYRKRSSVLNTSPVFLWNYLSLARLFELRVKKSSLLSLPTCPYVFFRFPRCVFPRRVLFIPPSPSTPLLRSVSHSFAAHYASLLCLRTRSVRLF